MPTRRTAPKLLGVGLAVLVPIAGCSTDGEARAIADALDKAKAVQAAIADDHVHNGDGYAHSAAQVDGVEVMMVDGTERASGDGVTLVIRVHGQAKDRSGFVVVDLAVCYRLVYGRKRNGEPDKVDCPDTPPLDIPKDPKLPLGIQDDLRDRLSAIPSPTEVDVRRVVDALYLDPRVQRDVMSADDAIGVALRASQYDCVLARIKDGVVDVWRPSRVQLAPGELLCKARVAAGGGGRTPPH